MEAARDRGVIIARLHLAEGYVENRSTSQASFADAGQASDLFEFHGGDLDADTWSSQATASDGSTREFLLTECRVRSEAFVEEVRGGRRRPPGDKGVIG